MRCIFYVLVFFIVSSCNPVEETKSLKLSHSLSLDHPVHEALVYFANQVEEKSKGELVVEIYPGGQLGSERESLELLQLGGLAMTKVSSAVMENFSPKLRVFGYPYLFEDREHRYKLYDSELGSELLKDGENYWLRGLTFFDAGSRSFYTKGISVTTPGDLKGLKIRVMQSPTAISLIKSLGGSPTPVSWGELYTSLQQGVVEGAENNLPSFYTSRHYEICKHLSLDEHSAIPDILVISTQIFNSLNSEEKNWILEAAQEASVKQRELWEQAEIDALEALEKEGVKITRPDKALFKKESSHIIEALEIKEPALYQTIQHIKSLKNE